MKKYWKWIAGLFVAGTSAYLLAGAGTVTMTVDGKDIPLTYTGIKGSDTLTIYTEKQDYTVNVPVAIGKKGNAPPVSPGVITVYFAVQNNSGKDQNVNIVFSSFDQVAPLQVQRLSGVEMKLSATTSQMEATTKSTWQTLSETTADRTSLLSKTALPTVNVQGTSNQTNSVFIANGKIEYFKIVYKVSLTPKASLGFTIEVFGDQGGYGKSQ